LPWAPVKLTDTRWVVPGARTLSPDSDLDAAVGLIPTNKKTEAAAATKPALRDRIIAAPVPSTAPEGLSLTSHVSLSWASHWS
jgi:hypothetical protein